MTRTERLKRKIKKQFGTISNFARQSKLDRYQLQKTFAKRSPPEMDVVCIEIALNKTLPKAGKMTPKKLKSLKAHLIASGGVITFCEQNPEFSRDTVFKILSGNRKMISGVTERLLKHFNL